MPSSRQDFDRIHQGLRERAHSMQIPELDEAADEIEALRDRLRRFDNLPRRTADGSVVWDLAEGDVCDECGRLYGVWWADHEVWNEVVGGDPHREAGGLLCPSCFVAKATGACIASRWKIVPDEQPEPSCCQVCGADDVPLEWVDTPYKGWLFVCMSPLACADRYQSKRWESKRWDSER